MTPDKDNKYTKMQLEFYNSEASKWTEQNPDPVVGSFKEHNEWSDYENLFVNLKDQKNKVGLDFACGPARNLVKYKGRFKRLDGVDLSPSNIENAKDYVAKNGITDANLIVCDGVGMPLVKSDEYDFVMSTIALQHICVYDIRKNIFKEIHRALKKGGMITAQMGFGANSPHTVGYYENYYEAKGTNRLCDVCVSDPDQIKKDLDELGFKDFKYIIGDVGPGDCHPNWIYFSAIKA